jgi:soluble lytic murein transglycosylase-like protein
MDAVGAIGEVGIMQLNPGPGGSYHAELEEATGADPTTPAGNIVCGVYMLGKYMDKYGDPAKVVMAYNMGEGGAKRAWAAGVTSTTYTTDILAAMEGGECTVNAWGGI